MKSSSEMILTETKDDTLKIGPLTGNKTEELKALVENMVNVSTIPMTLKKVIEVVGDENSSTSDLVKVIEHDQSLASRIIAVSNSAFYGFRGQVKSIPHAAVILGFDMVRNLAVSVSLFKATNSLKYLEKLWIHSFKVAMASSLLAERTGLVKKENAFLAGLINDLGRVILYQLYGDEYIKASSSGREVLLEREEEAFGATHSMVGKWFADSYKFQKECVLSIEAHHAPERYLTNYRAGSLHLIPIVYLADMLVSEGEEGFEFDLSPSPNHAEIMEAIYLDETGLREVKEALSGQEDEANTFYDD